MTESKNQGAPIPPDVARYLKGAPPESRQFDFLIGDWHVDATRYKEDGAVLFHYKGSWSAQSLNGGRMVMDDFKAHLPNGQDISYYVTLRTYSEARNRWEMTGLAALQPAANAEWHGVWTDGEMRLDALGTNPEGITVRNKIRFFDIAENSFIWESRTSHDDGKTWVKAVSMTAVRNTG